MSDTFFGFYNAENATDRIRSLYMLLKRAWCAGTCAPRLRGRWTPEQPSIGQCSVTAFAVQDLLGGEVFGIPLEDGGVHCFNVIGGNIYDLTSEQFDSPLEYTLEHPQSRSVHFEKAEKYQRYILLKERLKELTL